MQVSASMAGVGQWLQTKTAATCLSCATGTSAVSSFLLPNRSSSPPLQQEWHPEPRERWQQPTRNQSWAAPSPEVDVQLHHGLPLSQLARPTLEIRNPAIPCRSDFDQVAAGSSKEMHPLQHSSLSRQSLENCPQHPRASQLLVTTAPGGSLLKRWSCSGTKSRRHRTPSGDL